jgi:hypothetical protein
MYWNIKRGTLDIARVPSIRVVRDGDGRFITHDNRRLDVFRRLEQNKVLDQIAVEVVATPIPEWQMTTRNGGEEVTIRPRSEREEQAHVRTMKHIVKELEAVEKDTSLQEAERAEDEEVVDSQARGSSDTPLALVSGYSGVEEISPAKIATTPIDFARQTLISGQLPITAMPQLPRSSEQPLAEIVCTTQEDELTVSARLVDIKSNVLAISQDLVAQLTPKEMADLFHKADPTDV